MDFLAGAGLSLLVAGGSYLGLLWHPEPFFPYQLAQDGLLLASDRPFDEAAGRRVLAATRAKLDATPIAAPGRPLRAFICNDPADYRFFFNRSAGAAGVCMVPVPVVFLRASDVAANRMLDRLGGPVPPPRDLAYYLAHELAHDLCAVRFGALRYFASPAWVREGVADYVGRRGTYALAELVAAYKAGAPELDPSSTGRYDRYLMAVTYCLERRGMTLQQLWESPPSEAAVLRELSGPPGP